MYLQKNTATKICLHGAEVEQVINWWEQLNGDIFVNFYTNINEKLLGEQCVEVLILFLGFPPRTSPGFHCGNGKEPFLILEGRGKSNHSNICPIYAQSLLDKKDLISRRKINKNSKPKTLPECNSETLPQMRERNSHDYSFLQPSCLT